MDAEASEVVREMRPHRVVEVSDEGMGLQAFIVLDSLVLGPAAGGIRTAVYGSQAEAVSDACRLARTMTIKCALAGLDAGGGKAVVMDRPELDRAAGFALLGRRIESLGGQFRTSGDLGTTDADLAVVAQHTRYVHTDTGRLSSAVARGVLRCIEACVDFKGRSSVSGLTAVVQGCGDIGSAVARALTEAGVKLYLADIDVPVAEALAGALGAEVIDPQEALTADVDIVSPCAVGDVLSPDVAQSLRAWVVCGGANHITTSEEADRVLHSRGVLFIPDIVTSAGAAIEGIGRTVMGLDDRRPLLDALGDTARALLEDAAKANTPPLVHARARALRRIEAAQR
jgi:leucine dehydrogenase